MSQKSPVPAEASGPARDPSFNPQPPSSGRPASSFDILLVEDENALRSLLAQALRRAGYCVHEAVNGTDAVAFLMGGYPRMIITDIFMPEYDGFELLTRALLMYPRPAIIAMSGGAVGECETSLEIARHLGARRTFAKPFAVTALLDAVDEVLKAAAPAPPSVGLGAADVSKILPGE